MSFTDAYLRLEQIQQLLQNAENLHLEELVALQKEATECYEQCKWSLEKHEDILLDHHKED